MFILASLGLAVFGQGVGLVYLILELRRKESLLEECQKARLRERNETERNRDRMAQTIEASTAVLSRFAHQLRIRRLTRPVLTVPLPKGKP